MLGRSWSGDYDVSSRITLQFGDYSLSFVTNVPTKPLEGTLGQFRVAGPTVEVNVSAERMAQALELVLSHELNPSLYGNPLKQILLTPGALALLQEAKQTPVNPP